MDEKSEFVIKVIVGNQEKKQTRRIRISKIQNQEGKLSYEQLLWFVTKFNNEFNSQYNLEPVNIEDCNVKLTYYDVDSDLIHISSTDDLIEAMDQYLKQNFLRVYVNFELSQSRDIQEMKQKNAGVENGETQTSINNYVVSNDGTLTKSKTTPPDLIGQGKSADVVQIETEKLFIHGRHTCDICTVCPIVGNRFHATNLSNYDLCESCHKNFKGKHVQFEIEKLELDRVMQNQWQFKQKQRALRAAHKANPFPPSHHPGPIKGMVSSLSRFLQVVDNERNRYKEESKNAEAGIAEVQKDSVAERSDKTSGCIAEVGIIKTNGDTYDAINTNAATTKTKPATAATADHTKTTKNETMNANAKKAPPTFDAVGKKESSSGKEDKEAFIHGRHTCDMCFTQPIIGKRFHATNLPDFDICERCHENYKENDIVFEIVELDRDRQMQKHWQKIHQRCVRCPILRRIDTEGKKSDTQPGKSKNDAITVERKKFKESIENKVNEKNSQADTCELDFEPENLNKEEPSTVHRQADHEDIQKLTASEEEAKDTPTVSVQPVQRDRWRFQLRQLEDLGFEDESLYVEILERLAAANIGVDSKEEITVAQVLHEIYK